MGNAEIYISYHISALVLDQRLTMVIKLNLVCKHSQLHSFLPWNLFLSLTFVFQNTLHIVMNFHIISCYNSSVVHVSCTFYFMLCLSITVQNRQERRQVMKKKTTENQTKPNQTPKTIQKQTSKQKPKEKQNTPQCKYRVFTTYLLKHPSEGLYPSMGGGKEKKL